MQHVLAYTSPISMHCAILVTSQHYHTIDAIRGLDPASNDFLRRHTILEALPDQEAISAMPQGKHKQLTTSLTGRRLNTTMQSMLDLDSARVHVCL